MNPNTGEVRVGEDVKKLVADMREKQGDDQLRRMMQLPPPWVGFEAGEIVEVKRCCFRVLDMSQECLRLKPISREEAMLAARPEEET